MEKRGTEGRAFHFSASILKAPENRATQSRRDILAFVK